MNEEKRQHVSDAAALCIGLNGPARREMTRLMVNNGTVLLTVAEHEELVLREQTYHDAAAKALAERDALRAEVERFGRLVDLKNAQVRELEEHRDFLQDEIERLRKGRDDDARPEDVAAGGMVETASEGAHVRSASLVRAMGASLSADALDHRLGLPQPEGEPVAPMSARKPYRWGVV